MTIEVDRAARLANIIVRAPDAAPPVDAGAAQAQGAAWYPLKLARELDDAILMLRTNEGEIGTWVIRTRGDAAQMLAHDAFLARETGHWLVRATIGVGLMGQILGCWRKTVAGGASSSRHRQ